MDLVHRHLHPPISFLLLLLAVLQSFLCSTAASEPDEVCASEDSTGGEKRGACSAAAAASSSSEEVQGTGVFDAQQSREAFWKELRRHGLQLKLQPKMVQEKARNRTAMVVSEDVFYGRSIVKVPRYALISVETAEPKSLQQELTEFLFEKEKLAKVFNITGEDNQHLLSLAYPLIAMNRDPHCVYREWLDRLANQQLTVLQLTERQLKVLKGTTVDGSYEEMSRNRDLIKMTASNFSFFRKEPVGNAEAAWALAVIMRHARIVHPHQDVRNIRNPRMYLFPFVELLDVQLHPDAGTALPFQEEIVLEDGKREEEVVVQIARRDMPKGEEVFLWPGRLSNSEMVVRHGMSFQRNPIGIGRNITQPPNWNDNPSSKVRLEYEKYNCSTLEAFELRFSPLGTPSKSFVRCYRISWFLVNGWYSPGLQSRRRELDKWPPPKKYSKDDWLSWTQADAEVNRVILEYCRDMRGRLKDMLDSATAEDFRKSKDPLDKLIWKLRSEESKTFKECINAARAIS